ncbi:MAG: haloacid dehalogenase-like hydrolase [Clostridiales bacterium]|nr:haloacid dehalogenase-like hydrolase [Clostridiales bacterium]
MAVKNPVVAILYDFDKTLCTKDMQEYAFIPSLGLSAEEFWSETGKLAKAEKMDSILAYMYLMVRKSKAKMLPLKRDNFVRLGESVEFFNGVESWFDRIRQFGEENGVEIEHYIISSGLKEIIEGCPICDKFKEVYACEFHYDENGVADWPKTAVNYTTKTQFLFRINKGVTDITDDVNLNRFVPNDDRPVPFRNMIYIGDGMTDVPCMKLVKVNGGQSIAVYRDQRKETVTELLRDHRVDFIAPADYAEGNELDEIVKNIIQKMAAVNKLVETNRQQMQNSTR